MEQRRQQWMKGHPPQSSVGLIPLTDLDAGKYQGEEGGLYPGGKNNPPQSHLDAGIRLVLAVASGCFDRQAEKIGVLLPAKDRHYRDGALQGNVAGARE
jgi:hypothetical protein